jgi:excisionase family DNA binding protein
MSNENDSIHLRLNQIEHLLHELNLHQKQVFTSKEAARYLNLTQNHLYQLTHKKLIRYYCPGGKNIVFHRPDLDEYLLRNPSTTVHDEEAQVAQFLVKNSRNNSHSN